jgi:NAD(P)-dependent dehydrogenase (short-subunit alcohol dehydrogenase family)
MLQVRVGLEIPRHRASSLAADAARRLQFSRQKAQLGIISSLFRPDPAELAPLALHLASAASSYTTGAIIRVDGGITRKV